MAIPEHVRAAYLARYPHLRWTTDDKHFARNCLYLAAPNGVSALGLWHLADVAN